jgi:hypothetical protein
VPLTHLLKKKKRDDGVPFLTLFLRHMCRDGRSPIDEESYVVYPNEYLFGSGCPMTTTATFDVGGRRLRLTFLGGCDKVARIKKRIPRTFEQTWVKCTHIHTHFRSVDDIALFKKEI